MQSIRGILIEMTPRSFEAITRSIIKLLPKAWRLPAILLLLIGAAIWLYTASQSPQVATEKSSQTSAVIKVVDGDTFDVRLDGRIKRVRMIGVDTPEIVDPRKPVQCFGQQASEATHRLLDGQTVNLQADPTQDDIDKYGRLLRYVYLPDHTFVNQTLIQQGYAFEYTYLVPYQYQEQFKQAEAEAKQQQRGLWAPDACNGRP